MLITLLSLPTLPPPSPTLPLLLLQLPTLPPSMVEMYVCAEAVVTVILVDLVLELEFLMELEIQKFMQ